LANVKMLSAARPAKWGATVVPLFNAPADTATDRDTRAVVGDDAIGVLQQRSTLALASTTPVTPPTVNRKMILCAR
jgi:hypothetical protein